MKRISVKISDRNYALLKKEASRFSVERTVNKALKHFFEKNHRIRLRLRLKKGYKLSETVSTCLEEDGDF